MADGTLYTYPENFRAYKVCAAANYGDFKLTVDASYQHGTTNKTKDFQAKFPLGKVPALESSSGVCLNDSNAIAAFVSNGQLMGTKAEEEAQVMQWVGFSDQEILPAVCTWVFPCMGVMQYNKQNTERSKEEMKAILSTLNDHLSTRTFMVGERVTLADLSVATTLLLAYQWVLEPAFRSLYTHTNRWFETIINQPNVKKALPAGFKLCEKMAQFDAKLYAQMSGSDKKKSDDKKAKTKKEPAASTPKKAEKKPAEKKEAEAPPADEPPKEKKKNPFDQFPASDKFIMDEWKKCYSNEDTATVAIPFFWEKFDAEKYSIWHGEYMYNDDLSSMHFMNVNLMGGMEQRLDGMRKHGFGVHAYFGEPEKRLSGLYLAKGPKLPFSLSDDLNVDAESYKWRQVDVTNEKDKKLVEEYLLQETIDGKEVHTYKVFK